jgi:hypothetical protein
VPLLRRAFDILERAKLARLKERGQLCGTAERDSNPGEPFEADLAGPLEVAIGHLRDPSPFSQLCLGPLPL